MLRDLFVSIGSQWKCAPCCSNGRDKQLTAGSSSCQPSARPSEDQQPLPLVTAFKESTVDSEDVNFCLGSYDDRVPMKKARGDIPDSEAEGLAFDAASNRRVVHDCTVSLKKSLQKAEHDMQAEEEDKADKEQDGRRSAIRLEADKGELKMRVRMSVHDCSGMIHDAPAHVVSTPLMPENNPNLIEDVEPAGLAEWHRDESEMNLGSAKGKPKDGRPKDGRQLRSSTGDDSGDDGVRARYEKHQVSQKARDLRNMMKEEGIAPPDATLKGPHGKRSVQDSRQHAEKAYMAEIQNYQDDMRWKFEAIGIQTAKNEEFVATASPAAAVRDAVGKYHGHCQVMGKFYAMPGDANLDHYWLDREQKEKLVHYQRDLKAGTIDADVKLVQGASGGR